MNYVEVSLPAIAVNWFIGCTPEEQASTQPLLIHITYQVDRPLEDSLEQVCDYVVVVDFVKKQPIAFNLLEFAAVTVAENLLSSFHQMRSVRVKIEKPFAFPQKYTLPAAEYTAIKVL